MPFDLPLPETLREQGWRIEVLDRERLESPHATIRRGRREWRFNLRTATFMDPDPHPRMLPVEILSLLEDRRWELVVAWNLTYPANPVRGGNG